jgi:hypothetical protein
VLVLYIDIFVSLLAFCSFFYLVTLLLLLVSPLIYSLPCYLLLLVSGNCLSPSWRLPLWVYFIYNPPSFSGNIYKSICVRLLLTLVCCRCYVIWEISEHVSMLVTFSASEWDMLVVYGLDPFYVLVGDDY